MEWTEAGVAGAFRFTQRVFRLAEATRRRVPTATSPEQFGQAALALAACHPSHASPR